ncbi:MAG: mechanosensitive ion channel, partial [Lachnospiraceae bacterium]|nr:mechanosensitive ion channel [Lachnospiraceae bacterium]
MLFQNKEMEDVVEQMEQSADFLKENLDKLIAWATDKAASLVLAVLFLVIGFKVVKLIVKLSKKSFERHNVDASVAGFLISLMQILFNVLVCITSATILGFQMTSFITLLGTAGLAVGMALQGSLSNLAGGVLILLLKPFSIGDYIIEKGTGQEGTVTAIDIFYTRLTTVDNRMVVVPNGSLSATSIINVTANPTRRLDLTIDVAYDSDVDAVKQCLEEIIRADNRVLVTEPVDVFIDMFDASAIRMGIRFWIPGNEYWQVKWDMQQRIWDGLNQNGIQIQY